MLYILLQRYNFESNTQPSTDILEVFRSCKNHCKDTILKAILNGAIGLKQLKLLLRSGFLFFFCAAEYFHHINWRFLLELFAATIVCLLSRTTMPISSIGIVRSAVFLNEADSVSFLSTSGNRSTS